MPPFSNVTKTNVVFVETLRLMLTILRIDTIYQMGGYVLSNGISLCEPCHIKAGPVGNTPPIFTDSFFYKMIDSSFEKAYSDSENLMPC